ncbi:pentatricopeptide repeat-containing protein At4g22760 [Selaginella moellendorffii]|uniref:pentatricopeptide repeat-containing protein At4g22760 n=1 Tax=Selaginella moellendorffii TaxID=88036 RepID=UPI000D1CB980|nr:pentatricopeptide repeat-containing protein At4g22760 [Selaginella moellendorffii]|eukprot:XP_024526455.1 pentatricopeptide repeat-containing protein At4g22760 [Selaginella moellendorffii]
MEDEKTWVWNCVIRDYGMLGRVECAREAFLQCPARNFLSWKLLADAYAHKGHYGKVLEIEDKIPAVMYQLAPPPPSPASIFDAVSLYQKGKRWAAWELLQVFCHEGNGRKILFSALGKYKTVSMLLVFTSLLTYGDAQLFKLIRTMIEGSSLTEESLIHLACCQGKKEVKRLEDYYHGLHLSKTRGVPVTRGVSGVPVEAT